MTPAQMLLELERMDRKDALKSRSQVDANGVTITEKRPPQGAMGFTPDTTEVPRPGIDQEMTPVPSDTAGVGDQLAQLRATRQAELQARMYPASGAPQPSAEPPAPTPGIVGQMMNLPTAALAGAVTEQSATDPDPYLLKKPTEAAVAGIEERRKARELELAGRANAEASPEGIPQRFDVAGATGTGGAEISKGLVGAAGRLASDPTVALTGAAGLMRQAPKTLGKKAIEKGLRFPATTTSIADGATATKTSGPSPIYRLAEQLTGVPSEALRTASTKAGRQQLEAHAGKLREYAGEIIDHLDDNPIASFPERAKVNEALSKMPEMDVSSVFTKMREAKKPKAFTDEMKKANDLIESDAQAIAETLQGLSGAKPGQFFKSRLTAEDAYELRRQLDGITDFDLPSLGLTRTAANVVNNARKAARTELKNLLEKTAVESGNAEYPALMKSYASKLDKLEQVQKVLGKGSGISREDKAVNLLRRAANEEGESARKELLQAMDELFGEDFTKKTKLASMADALGPGGKATVFPRQTTGRALLGLATAGGVAGAFTVPGAGIAAAIPAIALGSPKVFTRITIPAARAAKLGAARMARIKNMVGEKKSPEMVRKLVNLGLTEAEINAAMQTAE